MVAGVEKGWRRTMPAVRGWMVNTLDLAEIRRLRQGALNENRPVAAVIRLPLPSAAAESEQLHDARPPLAGGRPWHTLRT